MGPPSDRSPPAGSRGAGTRILIVDDDEEVRNALAATLLEEGYAVALASTTEEALERARAERPDVILLDVHLPGESGWHFFSARLRHPELVDVPVVVLSADPQAERQVHSIGAAGFEAKPVRRQRLLETLTASRLRARAG